MVGHVGATAVVASGGIWQSLIMRYGFRRAWLFALLIVALTVGQVPSVGHAGSMPPNASAGMDMDGSASPPCDACDHMADLDNGAGCSLPCWNAGPALPVVASPMTAWLGHRFAPMPGSRLPDGRTIPPEPDPPRAFA